MESRERIRNAETGVIVGIVFAFVFMWYISYISFCWSTVFLDVVSICEELFRYSDILLKGLIIFLIPYEYIFSYLSNAVHVVLKVLKPTSAFADKIETEDLNFIWVVFLYFAMVLYSLDRYYLWYFRRMEYYLIMLAIIVMYMLYDFSSNKWIRYAVSCVLINVINAAVCYEITSDFTSTVMAFFLLLVSWHLYDTVANKKFDWVMIVTSLICTTLISIFGLYTTGHVTRLFEYLNPYKAVDNYTCTRMIYLRKEPFLSLWTGDVVRAWEHPFVCVNEMFGLWMVVIYFILFLFAGYEVIRQVKVSIDINAKRSCIFLTVFLWYAFAFLYCLICDMGYLPESSLSFTNLGFIVLIMAFMFRVMHEGRIYRGSIVDWKRIYELGHREVTEDIDESCEYCEANDTDDTENNCDEIDDNVENVEERKTVKERDILKDIYDRQETLFRAMIGINTRVINIEEELKDHLRRDEDSV